MADRRPLIQETPDLSESSENTPALPSLGFSNNSPAFGATGISPTRPGYARYQSDSTAVSRNTPSIVQEEDEEDEGDIAQSFQQGGKDTGLGIATTATSAVPQAARRVSIQPFPRRAAGPGPKSPPAKSPGPLSPLSATDPYFGHFPRSSAESTPDLRRERFSPEVGRASPVGSYEEFRHGILKNVKQNSNTSVNDYENYIQSSDAQRLRGGGAAPSIKSAYENDFRPVHECPTTKDFYHPKFTWLNFSIFTICLFSCVFSGIFLALAIRAPHYGRRITSHGPITPSDAILITTVMAKLIELSFVTAFVTFLGQVLSRRAFMKDHGRGVTLSELSMWRWVVQPGTLITSWESAKYAGLSFLGILSLLSAILATLYSSAAASLVQPMLRDGNWDNGLVLAGRVKSDFANINYLKHMCETPIRTDKEHQGETCVQLEHAGQGYHNFQRYLSDWDVAARNGNGSSDLRLRPQGFGLLYENTTVTGQWINIINTTEVSKKYGRVINNITMAMPHAGVFAAARDERNGILQPAELNSEGTYSLRAAVPSPVINVLCVNLNKTELAPLVYSEWPNDDTVNITTWVTTPGIRDRASTQNKTVVDELFGWDGNDTTTLNWPPVFGRYPIPFNTILNHTSNAWGRPAIYLLGQGGPDDMGRDGTGIYSVCKLQVSIAPGCSTRHNVTGSGGSMEVLCEDPKDRMAFRETGETPSKNTFGVANWRDVGTDWANSLSLGTGLMDANASTSRLLTQFILKPDNADPDNLKVELSRALPSMAEALAVLSSCTLLLSMVDTPFVTTWDYTHPALDEYQTQYFNASLKAQQYASGGMPGASKAWVIILALVFLMNIFVLIYFILHRGLVTDFSEPPNLFALAVNSPPSHVLAGSCGGGPQGKQYGVNWFVNHEGSHLYMEPGEKAPLMGGCDDGHVHTRAAGQGMGRGVSGFMASVTETVKRGLGLRIEQRPAKLGSVGAVEGFRPAVNTLRRGSIPSNYEMEDGLTRTRRQYQKLSKRRSVL
ncbi:hypothetical protein COCC4DRAFT_136959 [Bipolaris maydis ATCC 48331]|uniref:Uncharacterized protein n=2 Tax=Cochliobolus heterostrophus TaxID=5016 RepID=M2ULH4_COCH5|nr:uncharacterized protein COCC4DRAFT_136959 [Bipolaris maydis ATCC 48331]EMD88802.1 hypothetical protein COCHEDRAFT_1110428 [Bipolaris maydis C5]KAH7556556.1 hypothetical protein BM1_05990 [Bipolaris maydis]ENI05482.1 hypothetical protein COCC4DRAFT_136959 [Bipolaris maydis ATCC 48331]KAJ5028627.1 hypothetical protein J3E73DRAFT_33896 [Bipolaris maydis]KAJ5063408.1 hypothetical protein J3E74DRAFT_29710 [Bipolaris maydis]